MADAGHDYADAKLAEFQAEVAETYRQAEETARKRLEAHLKRFAKADDEKRKRVESGDMGKQAYADWRRSQMMTGYRYQQVLEQVADAYARADQVAVDAINGKLPQVYAENANYGGWQACEATGLNLSWSLMDADTAQHMLTSGQAMFAMPALDVAKDKAWNRRLMASQLTQGVLLGESIPKLAKRMERVTGSNYATAVRTARTAVTGAENAGRVASYKRAGEMGIRLQKEWLATLDGRTRHSHRQLDQEKVPEGEKFSNGCRYPGDPEGRYAEICNCRCTLVPALEGIDQDGAERWSRLPAGMTYEQWKGELEVSGGNDKVRETVSGMYKALDECGNRDLKNLFAKYRGKLKAKDEPGGTSHFSPTRGTVIIDASRSIAGSAIYGPHGLALHEFGHMVDWLSNGGKAFSSAKSGIVAAIDADWARYRAAVADSLVSERLIALSARDLAREMRRMGQDLGDDAMVEAARNARRLARDEGADFGRLYEDEPFRSAFDRFYKAAIGGRWEITSKEIDSSALEKVKSETDGKKLHQIASLSDVLQGASGVQYPLGVGHPPDYFKGSSANEARATEFFAEMCEAIAANPESYKELRRMFPTAVQEFESLIRRLAK